jgi:3-oxoacyl-[acyl-carrier-protein] synthase II
VHVSKRRVVITGLGVVSPLGIGHEPLWSGLLNGESGIRRLAAFDASRFRSQIGGEVPKFSMGDFVPKNYRKSTKVMARDIEIAVVAAHQATKDAGLRTKCLIDRGEVEASPNLDPTRFGANIGAGLICADLPELAGALATAADENRNFSLTRWGDEGMNNLTPLWLLKFLPNMLACHVTIVHDAQGASNTITCGEASSHLAIGEAFRTIARGAADICICGGAESKINPMGLIRQQMAGRLATAFNDDPARACRPFDKDRAGTAISEGGGLFILEELEHARGRRARIYAEVVGFGASSNAHSWTEPHPEGEGIALAAQKALADAGATAEAIDLVGAFGIGTVAHDLSEAKGLRQVLGGRANVPVLATKGALGNNGAGSGAIDLAAVTLAIFNNTIPPSPNTNQVDPACGLNVVTGDPVDARIGCAISVAYAVGGGQNAALVLKRYQE